MNIAIHHLFKKYKLRKHSSAHVSREKFRTFVDHFIYIIGLFSVVILLPQLINILHFKNSDSVSMVTWIGFVVSSSFWLMYGLIHRDWPITLTNAGSLIIDFLIIAAVLYYRQTPFL